MKIENLCIKCMREKRNANSVCEHCGFDSSKYQVPIHHMEPFSILAGKYLVGKSLGEGGFGITYIGMDLNLEMRVAIKEYYPNGFAVRDSSRTTTVQSYGGDAKEFFEVGREKFIGEARNLAKCTDIPEIVRVKEFFKENETAYIVMEYVDGINLKDYLKKRGGRLSVQETLDMMRPLIVALGKVHQSKLIHRDISPDNIMLLKDGNVKILDFGGARDFISSSGKSISIMLKRGYAPGEQYRTHGEQGPWTDIYALCATMYRCITGVVPPESLDREQRDELKPISAFGIECPQYVERVLEKGLSVYKEGRFQTMEELYGALYEGKPVSTYSYVERGNTAGTGNSFYNGKEAGSHNTVAGNNLRNISESGKEISGKAAKGKNTGIRIGVGILGGFLVVLLVVILIQLNQIKNTFDSEKSSEMAALEEVTPAVQKNEQEKDETENDIEDDTVVDVISEITSTPVPTNTPVPTDTPTPVVTEAPEPTLQTDVESLDYVRNNYVRLTEDDVAGADTSSMIKQDDIDNYPIYLFREDDQTNWQEGVSGPGIGEYVAYTLKQEYEIEAMSFRLGNWKTDRYFWGNNRPKTLEIIAGDNSWEITFPDEYKTEYVVTFNTPVKVTDLKFTIKDVYKGSQWDDTVITEISLWHE